MGASALTILFVLALVIGAIFGLVRGLRKSTVRLMFLVPAAIISFLVAKPVAVLLCGGLPLGELLTEGLKSSELFAQSVLLLDAAATLPVFLLAVVTLPVVFLLLEFITWIVFLFVGKKLVTLIFKDGTALERPGGAGVGLVSGVLCFAVMMAPCLALLDTLPAQETVDGAMDALVEQNELSREDAEMIVDAYSATDSAIVKLFGGLGRPYLRSASKFTSDGESVYLTDELNTIMAAVETALEGGLPAALAAEGDTAALLAVLDDQEFTDALLSDLLRSRIVCSVLPGAAASSVKGLALGMDVPADKAETIAVVVRDTLSAAVADETAALETASVLASILPGVADIIAAADDLSGDLSKLDFDGIEAVVTALQQSKLNAVGAALLDMVIYGNAAENATVRDLVVTLKTHYEKGDDLSGILGSAGALLSLASSMSEGGDKMVKNVRELIDNLDETSADMIVSALTEETFTDMGVPEEYAGTAQTAFGTIITGLAGLENEETYEAEAEAIAPVLELLTSGVSELGTEEIVQLAESTASSEVLHNTVVTLSESEDVDIDLADTELGDDVESAIREKYEQSESESERERYRDFAALLGLKLD